MLKMKHLVKRLYKKDLYTLWLKKKKKNLTRNFLDKEELYAM